MQKLVPRLAFAAALVASPLLGDVASAMEAYVDEDGKLTSKPADAQAPSASQEAAPAEQPREFSAPGGGVGVTIPRALLPHSKAEVRPDGSVAVECGEAGHKGGAR